MSAVCGFEAFINGKHVIGVVKEKEKAHQEYQEAVARGDGAYLLDHEKGDVFSVSLGNIPAGAEILIKIVYITELAMNHNELCFVLPTCVAPDVKDVASKSSLQAAGGSHAVQVETSETKLDIQVAVTMLAVIRRIHSPSHSILTKLTDTMATIQLDHNQTMQRGFILLIHLEDPHQPRFSFKTFEPKFHVMKLTFIFLFRMWQEEDENGHMATMITFYPEFGLSLAPETVSLILFIQH